jgi:branched-chain amino acid transport system ATP-binding protein
LSAPLLTTHGLTVTFGGVQALRSVDVAVKEGQLVGLIGPNGAGKTTFLDAIGGFVPSSGEVRLAGRPLQGLAPRRRARLGLGRTWQAVDLFDDLTVRENLAVAAQPRWQRSQPGSSIEKALCLLDLAHLADRLPEGLADGERKLVGVARALAAQPRLVCLDEPGAGLDNTACRELGERLRGLAATGLSIVLVDHDMGLVLSVCDHIYVLDFGRVLTDGTPSVVRGDRRVIDAYLGSDEASWVER